LTIAAGDFIVKAGVNATSEKLNSYGADRFTGSSHENERKFMSSRVQLPAGMEMIISIRRLRFDVSVSQFHA
jgi:hypothetical protein